MCVRGVIFSLRRNLFLLSCSLYILVAPFVYTSSFVCWYLPLAHYFNSFKAPCSQPHTGITLEITCFCIVLFAVEYSNNRIEILLFVFAIMNRIHSEVSGYSIRLFVNNRING